METSKLRATGILSGAHYWLLHIFSRNHFAERTTKKQSRKYASDKGKPKINVANESHC